MTEYANGSGRSKWYIFKCACAKEWLIDPPGGSGRARPHVFNTGREALAAFAAKPAAKQIAKQIIEDKNEWLNSH